VARPKPHRTFQVLGDEEASPRDDVFALGSRSASYLTMVPREIEQNSRHADLNISKASSLAMFQLDLRRSQE
jgi:hypothetical protein